LMALKEKLEKSQEKGNPQYELHSDEGDCAGADSTDLSLSSKSHTMSPKRQSGLTKEELERRKAEAQNYMDISYWKHFVSKQEHILEQVTEQIAENDRAQEECQKERHEANKQLHQAQQEVLTLEMRKKVVEQGIATSMTELLQARQALHRARELQEGEAK